MTAFLEKLATMPNIKYVHPPMEHHWGQQMVRFCDHGCHIVEVEEAIRIVVRRFLDSGMSAEQTAKRMDVPMEFVQSRLC